MSVRFQSIRFGAVEIDERDVIEFPFGLIGLIRDGPRPARGRRPGAAPRRRLGAG